jgi:iron-sulfur cluster assembly protein
MTPTAVEKIYELIKRNQLETETCYFRIGLKAGGCSGYSYIFDIVGECEEQDKILDFGKVRVCVDKKSYLFLNNMEIDYEDSPFKSGIKISNPAATRTCGCGESIAF